MSGISKLHEALLNLTNNSTIEYSKDKPYPIGGHVLGEEKNYLEGLLIKTDFPRRESFLLADFKDGPARALYMGESSHSMLYTLRGLELPNHWPNNLGENVFYIFLSNLEGIGDGPVSIDQSVVCDNLMPFQKVLERLVSLYDKRL